MCGIAGAMSGQWACDPNILRRMADALSHRGPDDSGVWTDGREIGLAHRRLSIIDLSAAAHQPMVSPTGRHVLVFNGEIYNHLGLRQLLRTPVAWRGHSDTETLLAGFSEWGVPDTLRRAVGMFSFALWDTQARVLTLGRDRLGEKPLYYGWQGGTFLFASELKALTTHPAFAAGVDRSAVATFMRHGYIPAPWSIYSDIHKLPAGTWMTVSAGPSASLTPESYWSLSDAMRAGLDNPFDGTEVEAVGTLESVLSQAVALQRVADVPLGAFLSGGVDSSMIVALMQAQSSRPVRTFTIGSEDGQYDEAAYARAVAQHLKTDHTELLVTAVEAQRVIPDLAHIYDEPFADSSQIPTLLVSQLARRQVTVSLSGDGGDELFGGYSRYMLTGTLGRYPAALRMMLARAITTIKASRWNRFGSFARPALPRGLRVAALGDQAYKLAALLRERSERDIYLHQTSMWKSPGDVVSGGADLIDRSGVWERLDRVDSLHRMMAFDTLTYLPDDILCKLDRASMHVSLETRVPFLDHRVVEFAWRLPAHTKVREHQGKWVLRQLLDKYVPRELIDRPKRGFSIPVGEWMRGPLRPWAEDLLDEARMKREGYLNARAVRQRWAEHLSGVRNWQHALWSVLMFQSWLAKSCATSQ